MRCVGFSGMLWSYVTTLCSPNEDFGRLNNHHLAKFTHPEHQCQYARTHSVASMEQQCKALAATALHCLKRRFWKSEQTFQRSFSKHFKRFVAQIRYSHPLKVLRKCTLKRWFGLPKSSFGEHKPATKDQSIPEKQSHRMILSFVQMWKNKIK